EAESLLKAAHRDDPNWPILRTRVNATPGAYSEIVNLDSAISDAVAGAEAASAARIAGLPRRSIAACQKVSPRLTTCGSRFTTRQSEEHWFAQTPANGGR
ncbi:MAG TPA: hypothetical protein VFW87_05335, partial [Pirellulales bacterium]|nr:hypothetical protein [Pirellulales bacterium]